MKNRCIAALLSAASLLLTGVLDPGNLLKLRIHATPAMQKKGIYNQKHH